MLRINAFSSFFCDFFYMIFVNHLVIFPRFVYFHVLFCDFSCDPFTVYSNVIVTQFIS